jgi:TrmH family RNA methyltransferase
VKIYSLNLHELLSKLNNKTVVYGATLTGHNIYREELNPAGILIIGNESTGISSEVMKYVTIPLSVPNVRETGEKGAESLNAAVAAGIIIAEFNRQANTRINIF